MCRNIPRIQLPATGERACERRNCQHLTCAWEHLGGWISSVTSVSIARRSFSRSDQLRLGRGAEVHFAKC